MKSRPYQAATARRKTTVSRKSEEKMPNTLKDRSEQNNVRDLSTHSSQGKRQQEKTEKKKGVKVHHPSAKCKKDVRRGARDGGEKRRLGTREQRISSGEKNPKEKRPARAFRTENSLNTKDIT